ncbi:hypothetical protein EDC96DRAFT_590957 [Choanephora cucurbitarum]|nr:hypothetical protein EDC96DRAFT_590957 [Choanephora cucurbitarum]
MAGQSDKGKRKAQDDEESLKIITEEGGTDNNQTMEDAPSADDLYEAVMSGRKSPLSGVKLDDDFCKSIQYKGFNPKTAHKKALVKFGFDAAYKLATIGSIRRNNIDKFGDIMIECDGKVKGTYSLKKLAELQHIRTYGMRSPEDPVRPEVYSLTQIASAMPYSVFYYVKALEEKGKDVSKFCKNVDTSLPVCLQYMEAAALPLPKKLRSAHIAFAENYSKFLKSTINGNIYRQRVSVSHMYTRLVGLVELLQAEEDKIVLNEEEQTKTVEGLPRYFKTYNNDMAQRNTRMNIQPRMGRTARRGPY